MIELDNRYNPLELKNPRLVDGATFDTALRETEVWDEPWKLIYLRKSNDKMYDIFKYTLDHGDTKLWIKNRYRNEVGPWIEGTQFTDAIWNELQKDKFEKWDIVYLRVPDLRAFPEMTIDDIYNLTYDEIEKILAGYNRNPESAGELYKIVDDRSSDNIWKCFIINGKKLYVQLEYGNHEILKSGKSCILLAYSEGEIFIDGIWRYDWKNFNGVVNKNGKTEKWAIELFDSRYK